MYDLKIRKFIHCRFLFFSLLASFIGYSQMLFSQVGEGGLPPSFKYQPTTRSATLATSVPIDFYIEDLRETDVWMSHEASPLRVSKLIAVDYTMENAGYHTVLPDGTDIWRLHLKARDAVAIMLYYSDFYIPEGGRLFIYSPDYAQVLGAYTHRTHPSGGLFATEFIGGDALILEYVASETSEEKPRISIHDIGFGFNTSALREFCGVTTRAVSGDCEVNINCEEGIAWQNEKKSICYTIQRIGSDAYICTGSLLNNTAEDLKPFILTAVHCAYDPKYTVRASETDMEQWAFYFNREREGCSNSSMGKVSKTMIGCKLLVSTGLTGGSDGLLLLLKDTIPANYDVFYNGWDYSGNDGLSGVCIHHPEGDLKKISTYDEPTKSFPWPNQPNFDKNAHINVIFKATPNGYGVTEPGSSGSPLYNENKLVIGTLSGGSSSCTLQKGMNLYGKFSFHWDRYKTDSMHMDIWLDPLKKDVKTLNGRYRNELKPAPVNLHITNLGQSILLTWEPPQGSEEPLFYYVYRNNMKLADTIELSYIDQEPILGSIAYSVSAVYENDEESAFVTKTIGIIKYKSPTDVKAVRMGETSDQVQLSWKPPLYEQTIFWGLMTPAYRIGFEKNTFYYGQRWSADEIQPLHKTMIKAVRFYPIEKNTYEIYITQGAYDYRQPIDNASLKPRSMNTVELNTPFIIDGSSSLIVSIYISNVDELPAVTDNGPLISGKGNLCSVDGLEWWELNEGEAPGEFEYNFIVAALISSETGVLSTLSRSHDIANKSKSGKMAVPPNLQLRKVALNIDDQTFSTRSSMPAAFPEITKHRIYRNGSYYKEVIAPETSYLDSYNTSNTYYQVSAIYDLGESEKSEIANITVVANETLGTSVQIFPTHFSDFITLQGSELVKRIEFFSLSGKVCLVVAQPGQQINTNSLASGLYFIRIIDVYNRQHVVKAIKK